MATRRVLIVEDDDATAWFAKASLEEEGYEVIVLNTLSSEAVRAAVARIEPDCVLLDGADAGDYGHAWEEAAWLRTRPRPIPVIMFSASHAAILEARLATSERSLAAAFAAVLAKPFDLEELIQVVSRASANGLTS